MRFVTACIIMAVVAAGCGDSDDDPSINLPAYAPCDALAAEGTEGACPPADESGS